MPDWQNPDAYRFTESLSREQWAWEFLRRNPEYQKEWQCFWAIWQALEAEYGAPPHRDFQRWKLDPRAYVIGTDAGECFASDSCKVDGDKVLIECWLGAKWGFYKFPLDPATDRPVIGEQLAWREVSQGVIRVDAGSSDYLGREAGKLALGFDLALPLRDQLERAKTYLIASQRRLQQEGEVQPKCITGMRVYLTLCLRLLDAHASGADEQDIAQRLGVENLAQFSAEAQALCAGGYRHLLSLPE